MHPGFPNPTACPAWHAWHLQARGLNSTSELYRQFINTMRQYAAGKGKQLIVWEGFAPQRGQAGRSAKPASSVAIPADNIIVTPCGLLPVSPSRFQSPVLGILF